MSLLNGLVITTGNSMEFTGLVCVLKQCLVTDEFLSPLDELHARQHVSGVYL